MKNQKKVEPVDIDIIDKEIQDSTGVDIVKNIEKIKSPNLGLDLYPVRMGKDVYFIKNRNIGVKY
jgi:hypothetical protein